MVYIGDDGFAFTININASTVCWYISEVFDNMSSFEGDMETCKELWTYCENLEKYLIDDALTWDKNHPEFNLDIFRKICDKIDGWEQLIEYFE